MGRRKLSLAAAAAAALVALPAGWYFGSPWWTLWRMREAARAGDLATFASHVDRPVLAARSKAQARIWLESILTTPLGDSESAQRLRAFALRRLAEMERWGGDSPADFTRWLAEVPVRWGGLGGYRTRDYDPVIVHYGLDRLDLRDRRARDELGPVLSFRRHGLGWKLEEGRFGQQ